MPDDNFQTKKMAKKMNIHDILYYSVYFQNISCLFINY